MLASTATAYGPNLLARLLAARSLLQVDDCARAAWILNGEGLIADEEMAYLAPVIEHQRKSIQTEACCRPHPVFCHGRASQSCHRRPPIPQDKKKASWLRRRGLAKDCIIPTCIARMFTVSKLAVLAVIVRAVIERGFSRMSLPEIAARAGVGCTTARYALRDAARMGLIAITENRLNKRWHRPNTIRIACRRWLVWLRGHRTAKARRHTAAPPVPLGDLTPLRNMSPTVEIHRFSTQKSGFCGVRPAAFEHFQFAWRWSVTSFSGETLQLT